MAIETVGLFLDRLMDGLQQAIVDARNAGLNLEVEAGRELNIAIDNAKNAYSGMLDQTIDKIDKTSRGILDQLASMVQEVQEKNDVTLRTTAQRVQQIINTLPFAYLQPQVTDISPRFIAPSAKQYDVIVTFFGNFPYSAGEKLKPEFSINGSKFSPVQNTTQELKFSIPATVLFPAGTVDLSKITLATGDLKLPWLKSEWFGLRHVDVTDSYKILLGALPSSPGQITFEYTTPRVVVERQPFVSSGFHLASTREAGNNDQKDVPFTVTSHAGWHVVRGSSRIINFNGQGDYSYPHFISDGGDSVTYQATTIHHGLGSSGSMDFAIAFDEYREVTVQDLHTQNIDLKWGDSVVLGQSVGKIIFQAFDGSRYEFAGADLSNRYIKVRNEAGNLVISTADPSILTIPSANAHAREFMQTLEYAF